MSIIWGMFDVHTVLRVGFYSHLQASAYHDTKKVKLSLCLTKHYAMKTYWEWRYSSTHSLTSTLDGGEWSASRPGRFTPKERAPGTHWIGGWVGLRAGLDAVVKGKIPSPSRESNPRTPIIQTFIILILMATVGIVPETFQILSCYESHYKSGRLSNEVWLWSSRNDFIAPLKVSHATWS
jgi:hypothetical protein